MESSVSNKLFQKELGHALDSCRVCMAHDSKMSYLFEEGRNNIIEEVEFCTGLLLTNEDGLPSKICDVCLKNLSVAFKFKTACLLADRTFRNLIATTIKIEVEEVDIQHDSDDVMQNDDQSDTKPDVNVMGHTLIQNGVAKQKRKKFNGEKDITKNRKIRGTHQKRSPNVKTETQRPVMKAKRNLLACEACDLKFQTREQVVAHKKALHRDTECWVCEICGKLFIHRASHYSHVKSHHPPEYACDRCEYRTSYKHDLVKHLRMHSGIKPYHCEYCASSYYTSSNLTSHVRRFHDKQKRYACTMCDKSFYDRTKINRHMDSHNEVRRFECEVCHACFTRRCYWKKHRLQQHDIVTPPQRPGRQKVNFIVSLQTKDSASVEKLS